MERVVAWPGVTGPGFVNLHWTTTATDGKSPWRGAPFKTASELLERAQNLVAQPGKINDIYFCTSVQAACSTHTNGVQIAKRSKNAATLIKALWLDVDVKEPPKWPDRYFVPGKLRD